MFLALRTVPAVAFTKVLWSSELPKTLVDRLFLLHKVRLFLRGDHSWMSDEIHELVHFICLLFYFKVLLQEKDLKLKSLICFLLFGFDWSVNHGDINISYVTVLIQRAFVFKKCSVPFKSVYVKVSSQVLSQGFVPPYRHWKVSLCLIWRLIGSLKLHVFIRCLTLSITTSDINDERYRRLVNLVKSIAHRLSRVIEAIKLLIGRLVSVLVR